VQDGVTYALSQMHLKPMTKHLKKELYLMREKLAPMVLSASLAVGGYAALDNETRAGGETCEEANARQDAEIMATYRTAVDADRLATILYVALTGQQGNAYTYEQYRDLFEFMVEDIQEGHDPLAPGFRQDVGLENVSPSPTPKTIYEEGGED